MATEAFKAGPSRCYVSVVDSTTSLPSFATLAFTASGVDMTDNVRNSTLKGLDTTLTYQVVLCPRGADTTTSGYAIGRGSPSSGNLTLTTGQCIEITVALGAWPANYEKGFVDAFLKTGSGDFQLAASVKPSTAGSTKFVIMTKPTSESFTLAQLQSTTPSSSLKALGDRAPKAYLFQEITPTTGPVNVSFTQGNTVTFSPNTSADFQVVGARPVAVNFQGMVNSEKAITQATAGDWTEWQSGGVTYQQGQFGMNTAQILAKGNAPFIMEFPADPDTGAVTQVLFFGLLLQNQDEVSLAWSKTDQTPVTYNFQPAPLDKLLNNQPTVYTYNIND